MCKKCDGFGCKGELPGMGGVYESENFIKNVSAWNEFYNNFSDEQKNEISLISTEGKIGLAPVTGAIQNIGFENEEDFYLPYFETGIAKNYFICSGDGTPDDKLKFSLDAVKKLGIKSYFFLKPYPDEILKNRFSLVKYYALGIGVDIDAYNIVTMRNLVHLEKKTSQSLGRLKEYSSLPLLVKGIFTQEDIELCKVLKPDVAVISNHGGRVETEKGSTCSFLYKNAKILKNYVKELWVDGGLRTQKNIQTALYLGADRVLIARPLIAETCRKFMGI